MNEERVQTVQRYEQCKKPFDKGGPNLQQVWAQTNSIDL